MLTNDITKYKLTENVYDLTDAQIYFYILCNNKMIELIESAKNEAKSSTPSNSDNTFHISGTDDPELIKAKVESLKNSMKKV